MAKTVSFAAAVLLGGVLLAPDVEAQRRGRFRLNVPKKDPTQWGVLPPPKANPLGQIFPSPTQKKASAGRGAGRDQGRGADLTSHTPKLPPYLVGAPTRIVERYDEKTVSGYFRTVDINEDRWLSYREMWMAWGTSRGEFVVIDSDQDGGVVLTELDHRFRLIVETGGAFLVPYRRGPGPPKAAKKQDPPPAASAAPPKKRPALPAKPESKPVSETARAMEAGFRHFDADGNARLSVKEVSNLLVKTGLMPESGVATAIEGLNAHDRDKDGEWTLTEFLMFLKI